MGPAAPDDPPPAWADSLQPAPTDLALLGDAVAGNSDAEGAAAVQPATSDTVEGLAAGQAGGSGSGGSGGHGTVEPFPLELLPVLPRAGWRAMPLSPPRHGAEGRRRRLVQHAPCGRTSALASSRRCGGKAAVRNHGALLLVVVAVTVGVCPMCNFGIQVGHLRARGA